MKKTSQSLLLASAAALGLFAGTKGKADAQQAQVQIGGGGARITGVYAGWPATRCRTFPRLLPASLDVDDIVVGVNGRAVRSLNDLRQAIQRSQGAALFEVIDCNTKRHVFLWIRPAMDFDGLKKIGVDAETVALPPGPAFGPK